jgi:hypothetical protein
VKNVVLQLEPLMIIIGTKLLVVFNMPFVLEKLEFALAFRISLITKMELVLKKEDLVLVARRRKHAVLIWAFLVSKELAHVTLRMPSIVK